MYNMSEKQRHSGDDDEVIRELCSVNGVSFEEIPLEGSSITSLEIFFSGYPRMVGLAHFPRLCQLTVVNQNIGQIQGLESCPLLQELWVAECKLTDISGLQNSHKLQKLYLYDNQIRRIENLESLFNLKVLWLNKNLITHIEGLNTLRNLKELNLADNSIEKIGHCLDSNINLENLNLSGNKISSFKELTRLAALPCLTELALKDPQSSPTPVCLLCNYATHMLYHMPGLQRLDTYDVSSKQVKDAAESTVMKKIMYYNMRVRTAKRNLANTRADLLENKRDLLKLPEERIRTLHFALKNLECELSEVQALCKRSGRSGEEEPSPLSDSHVDISHITSLGHKILSKQNALKERMILWNRKMEEIESWCQQDLALASSRNEQMIHFLLMELETVGNIRFEEGCSTDPWFTSCCDILQSRFCAWDYKAYGVIGIKINRIIRIHNRALRFRFDDKLLMVLDRDESTTFTQNYKRWLEYLFYVSDPERDCEMNEMLHIPEDGFKTAEMFQALGREAAVPVSNSLSVTDRSRIEYTQRQANQSNTKQSINPHLFRHGQVILCKVFIGRSFQVKDGDSVASCKYPKAHSVYRSVDSDQKTGGDVKLSGVVHSGCDCNLRQWFVFDHELVLPEYLIDFEYITQDQANTVLAGPSYPGMDNTFTHDINLDKDILDMEPALKPRPKMLFLDEKTLLNVARANVLSQITVLNLHGNSLNKLKEISHLTALRHLTISFNEFTHLDDISHMNHLEFVDASFNRVQNLDGLRGLRCLKQLDLCWNQLTQAREDTAVLRKHAPSLLTLDTRHNPWHNPSGVRMAVLGRLSTLTHLDEVLVTEEEAAAAVKMAAGSKINQASLLAHSRTARERPRGLSLLSAALLLDQLSPSPWDITGAPEPGWTTKITALNLDGQRLSKLTNLDKLVNLRWASFNDNDISIVEGLDNCRHLEELSLNDNCISKLDGMSKLQQLTKLSVNGNKLSCLNGTSLDRLPYLHFLSVENNLIGSLNGVHRARSLLELYVGNNMISTTRNIYHLKVLTNLVILEMYGNPIVEKLDYYRIYVVFHLPALKALDGIAVEVTECENAKNMFGGRLTPDMLAEKLGHLNHSGMVDLYLQSCDIRTVDLVPADLFHNLHTVNLEHNNLTSFSGLVYLPNIKTLCLNYNHIESILPRQKVPSYLTNRQILHQKVNSSGYGQHSSSKGTREAGPADSLEPLMGSLEVLHLSYNGISNMANLQLSRLPNLKALFLQGNEIFQVDGLEGLERLQELDLDQNRIRSVGENSFFGQVVLLKLHLTENRLRELNHLQPLTALRRLFLGLNKIQDISELDKLDILPSLIELSVVGNPVARLSIRPAVILRLSRLQILDGVEISQEEKTRAKQVCTEAQCPMASGSSMHMNLSGLLPLMPRSVPPGGISLSGGLQHYQSPDMIIPNHLDDALTHDMSKYKRQKQSSAGIHTHIHALAEMSFRQIRGSASTLPNTSLLSTGSRLPISRPNQEDSMSALLCTGSRVPIPRPNQEDSRFHSGGAPKPPF
ncbi:hypothetical protein DPEC_G00290290 [Dallia pectoralis]|uniref:Uncharacterized protein n=1 Tax=Dallia pectoralis TaxID=75939 RepID=A0ACC2FHC4_DALPE|nr:hypothetical protein DPEC_G00290290 [Dallia pectoralis]